MTVGHLQSPPSLQLIDNLCTGFVGSNSPFIGGSDTKSVESTMFIAAGCIVCSRWPRALWALSA